MALQFLAPLAGAALGFLGSKDQSDSQLEAARLARELPDWQRPFMLGNPGPAPQPIPINYNWLDAIYNAASSGMPQDIPPMSMNDPRMTMENVYRPDPGGFHGYGTPPAELQNQPPAAAAPGGGLPSMEDLERARLLQQMARLRTALDTTTSEDVIGQPMGTLDALIMAQQNPNMDPTRTGAWGVLNQLSMGD